MGTAASTEALQKEASAPKPILKRQIELDFIRGIAILMVIHVHDAAYVVPGEEHGLGVHWPVINFGWAGVDLFFVLSGFLVGGLLCKEWKQSGKVRAGRFLLRRGFKIWPLYYVYLLVYVILRRYPLHTFFWANLLNIQNYMGTTLRVTWSLAVEEHFYLLLTAAIWWASSKQLPIQKFLNGCIVVALAVIAYRTYLANSGKSFIYQTHTRIDELLLGVMLAILFHFFPARFLQLQSKRALLWICLSVSICILLWLDVKNTSGIQIIASELGAVAFFLLVYRPQEAKHSWLYRCVAALGVYSYGVYLWHYSTITPVMILLHKLPPVAMYLRYPLTTISGIALGVFMTKIIEFPFLRLRERFVPRNPEYELKASRSTQDAQVSAF